MDEMYAANRINTTSNHNSNPAVDDEYYGCCYCEDGLTIAISLSTAYTIIILGSGVAAVGDLGKVRCDCITIDVTFNIDSHEK